MSKTDFLKRAVLNHTMRNAAYTPPAVVYLALFTSPTTDAGGGTEVVGKGYVRQPATFAAPDANHVIINNAAITFPVATPNGYGNITHGAYFDALSGGNMLRHAPLAAPRAVSAGDAVTFPAGQAIITED